MAFVLPTFPSSVDIYDWVAFGVPTSLRLTSPCQLRGPNPSYAINYTSVSSFAPASLILLPALTDIRDRYNTPINRPDFVQVPAGSGRWYHVVYVDDIAKEFPNEHRYAAIAKLDPLPWPTPSP